MGLDLGRKGQGDILFLSQLGSGDNLLKENFEGPSWA